ncbi:MAG: hypothetical protein JOZ82_05905 [Marmoricola sp.]|nr:hypothetical protein [Marmoricola sp.]
MSWKLAALGYVVLEGVLGAVAFSAEDAKPVVEWIAFLLLLPGLVVTLPVIYVCGAWAWNLRDSLPHQPMWPVTLIFTTLFVAAAVVNVALVRVLTRAVLRRRRRTAAQLTPRG